jgi:hypothetical protein
LVGITERFPQAGTTSPIWASGSCRHGKLHTDAESRVKKKEELTGILIFNFSLTYHNVGRFQEIISGLSLIINPKSRPANARVIF